jgi:hypothetical protein
MSTGTGNMSFMSEASMMSIVSDIRKSTFFGGVNETTGQAQMQFPLSHVHLVPISCETNVLLNSSSSSSRRRPAYHDFCLPYGDSLQLGHLYKVAVDDEEFEEYHRAAEDPLCWLGDDDDLYDDHYGDHGQKCRCDCPNCATCAHKKAGGRLPTNYFCLTVQDNLYRRVLDEICASEQMPCGLFFCGHHADVSRPSIAIAVCLLSTLFGAMGLIAFFFRS